MREFGAPLSPTRAAEVAAAIATLFERLPGRREVLGEAYMMAPSDKAVITIGEIKAKGGPKLKIGATKLSARPPFEWLYELTSDVGEADYFKHYLVLPDQIVLAHLKVLTPIDEVEAQVIMNDLAVVTAALDEAA